ncbi:MAG: rhomboid family intramembrane serine protease [Desulfobulbaceae bacterium]|nr:rhomboid family intramembrane serine protease [Desulfobulbaceae bacterium]
MLYRDSFFLQSLPSGTHVQTKRSIHMPPRNVILSPDVTGRDPNPIIAAGSPDYLALCSLVLSSVGIPHAYSPRGDGLTVDEEFAEAARHHLEQYFEENEGWPERPPPYQPARFSSNPPTLLIIGALALFFWVTGPWQDNVAWFSRGAIDSRAILEQGEWWRLVTALTLHADQAHLIGNCIIGGFIVHLLGKTTGYGLSLLLLVACGSLGNLLNIITRDEAHLSVGFSTSIFAAIGLLSGMQIFAGPLKGFKNLLIPLGAGAALLAMLGAGGERTDLGAHFFGFLCGIGIGMLIRHFDLVRLASRPGRQLSLFTLALLFIIVSWEMALGP